MVICVPIWYNDVIPFEVVGWKVYERKRDYMKNWKAVTVTLVLLALCMVPCIAFALAKDSDAEATKENERVATYALEEEASEDGKAVLGEKGQEGSIKEVILLTILAVVIALLCAYLPDKRREQWRREAEEEAAARNREKNQE